MKNSFKIVVDACVARAAPRKSSPEVLPEKCFEFFDGLKKSNHSLVFDSKLDIEWRDHASTFAKQALLRLSQEKRVVRLKEKDFNDEFEKINRCLEDSIAKSKKKPPEEFSAAEKDMHLLVCAFSTDKIVVSSETKCLKQFRKMKANISCEFLSSIRWYDPTDKDLDIKLFLNYPRKAKKI